MIVTDWREGVRQSLGQILESPNWLSGASRAARLFIEQNYDERENRWGEFYNGNQPKTQRGLRPQPKSLFGY
jgi:hypothetical protein